MSNYFVHLRYNWLMTQDDFNKLLSTVEEQSSTVRFDLQISESLNKLIDDNKDNFSPEQFEQIKWEFLLFRLMTKNRFSSDGLKTERFVPLATFANGSIFPDPNSFPPEALDYFENRLTVVKNPIFRSRYLDFLWEKSKSKDKHLFAIEAVNQYLLAIDAYENEEAVMERLDCLQRATELSLIFEKNKADKPMMLKVVSELNKQIEITSNSKKYRWLIELFEIVISISTLYTKEQIVNFINTCEEAEKFYLADRNFHLQRSFIKLRLELTRTFDNSQDTKTLIDTQEAQSYVDEANSKSESGLVKVHFLQEAIEKYSNIGNKQKVDELIKEVKTATKQAIDNKEFHQFSTTIELKKEDYEKMKTDLGVGDEIPQKMGILPFFFPNWSAAVELTKKLSKKYVFQHLVNTVHYGDKYPISTPKTKEEADDDHVMQNYRIQVELSNRWLTKIIEELIQEKKVSIKNFKVYFSKLKEFDNDTHNTVLEGLKSYFKKDYFNATYVLTLQLEDFLRLLLAGFGGQTTVPEYGAFREKTLGSILFELKPYISEPVYRYISFVMEDFRGYNLRNNIAHGFFKKKDESPIYPTAILHIFCLLIANTKIVIKENK